jgi:hypothetical protein|tara:strand:+ start:475 stop:663 length:189 start_codon:yes stop_codon:yes gene_type:complete
MDKIIDKKTTVEMMYNLLNTKELKEFNEVIENVLELNDYTLEEIKTMSMDKFLQILDWDLYT